MYIPVEVVKIYAWDKLVGAVAAGGRRAYVFEYAPEWLRSGVELAPVLMPRSPRRNHYQFLGLSTETFYGLPPMLADSTPDKFGNSIIDATLQREGVRPDQVSALDRLAYVGKRGMGALTFEPDRSPGGLLPTSIELVELVESARAVVRGDLHSDETKSASLRTLIAVGTSAGGARAKAVVAWNRATDELRAGSIAAPDGFEQWLLKFDIDQSGTLGDPAGFGLIEYSYSLLAAAAGVQMAECRLLREGNRAHFMTRRFDRDDNGSRIHMQSLCGLAGIDFNARAVNDYAGLFVTADALGLGEDDRAQLFRRMVFNVVASNCDDHSKNFAFLMSRDGTWQLAPAYDLTYAYHPASVWVSQHLMGIDGKFDQISRKDLMGFARTFQIPGAKQIIDEVRDAVAEWPTVAAEVGVPASQQEMIIRRLADVDRELHGQ